MYKRMLAVLVCLILALMLSGCGSKENTATQAPAPTATPEPVAAAADPLNPKGVDFGGRTVTIWASWQADPRRSESAKKEPAYEENCAHWDAVEKAFNCKIDVMTQEDFDYFRNGFLTAYASGEVVADIVAGDMTYSYPTWIINDMLAPIEGYLDVYDQSGQSLWDKNVSENFTYNGHCYAVKEKNLTLPKFVMYFNADLFAAQESLKGYDLFELVRGKQWTWDKLLEVAKAGTIDLDGDGQTDIMGLSTRAQPGSFLIDGLVSSNGCYFVKKDGDKVVFDLDSPAGMAALEFAYRMAWDDMCLGITGIFDSWVGGIDEFKAGRVALFAGDRGDMDLINSVDFKLGMVPIPIGPTQTDYIGDYPAFDFWGLVAGSPEPEKCAYLMEALLNDGRQHTIESSYEHLVNMEENLEMIEIMVNSRAYTAYYGYQVFIDEMLWSDYGLRSQMSPATFVAEKKPIISTALDALWSKLGEDEDF